MLRKRGGGNSKQVSARNKAIVPFADPNTHVTVVTAVPNKSLNRPSGTLNLMTPITAVLLLAGRLVQAEGKGKRDRANELKAY